MGKEFKIAVILSAYDKMSQVMNGAVMKAEKKIKGLQKGLNNFGKNAFIGGAAATAFFVSSTLAAENYETAVSRVKQVFKSMGQDYEKAAKESEAYADSLSSTVGVEREVILATQAKIATFEHVANVSARASGIYNRATKAAVDMQATGFGDATNNAVQLGKALEDPIKGVNALRRSGITFTEAEKTKIKALVESGKRLKAQDMIMRAVEKQVGGVAKATVNDSDKMKVAWKNTQVEIGKALLPMLVKLTSKVLEITKKIRAFAKAHPDLIEKAAKAAVLLMALGAAAKVVAFVMGGIVPVIKGVGMAIRFVSGTFKALQLIFSIGGGPLTLIIMGIALAVFLIIKYWKPIKSFFIKIWEGIKAVFVPVIKLLWGYIMNFTPIGWIIKFWKPLSRLFGAIWGLVKAVIMVALGILKKLFLNFTPLGLIIKHWKPISKFFADLWNKVKKPFISIFNWVMGFGKKFYNAGANIINSIIKGITSKIDKITNTIKGVTKKIRDFFPFSPAKTGPLKDIHKIKLVETIAASVSAKPLTDAMHRVTGAVAGVGMSRPVPQLAARTAGGGSMNVTYAPTINAGAGADRNSLKDLLDQHADDFMRRLEEAQRRKDRKQF